MAAFMGRHAQRCGRSAVIISLEKHRAFAKRIVMVAQQLFVLNDVNVGDARLTQNLFAHFCPGVAGECGRMTVPRLRPFDVPLREQRDDQRNEENEQDHTISFRCVKLFLLRKSPRALFNHRRAHGNSIAKIANPAGITMKAGPGSTIKAMPTASTVPPTTATTMFLTCFIVRRSSINHSAPSAEMETAWSGGGASFRENPRPSVRRVAVATLRLLARVRL